MEALGPSGWVGHLLLWDWLRFRTQSRRLAFWAKQLVAELDQLQGTGTALDKAARIVGILCEGTEGPAYEVWELAPDEPRRAA
jgi:hypothetical protein